MDFNLEEMTCYAKDVTRDGKTVCVQVEFCDPEGWRLRIAGNQSEACEWTEFFPSAREAMITGFRAIEEEGIDEFYRNPVFGYLDQAPRA